MQKSDSTQNLSRNAVVDQRDHTPTQIKNEVVAERISSGNVEISVQCKRSRHMLILRDEGPAVQTLKLGQ